MADKRLTDLTFIPSLTTGSLVYIVDGSLSYKGTLTQFVSALNSLYYMGTTYTGIGSPEGVVSSPIGGFYLDVPSTGFYWKIQGTNANGWTQLIG